MSTNAEQPKPDDPAPRKRGGWLRREGINVGDAVVQFFSVLLGVLLALLISQWTNHRQQEAKARAALHEQQATVNEAMRAIKTELSANRAALHISVATLYAAATRILDAPANRKQPPRPCEMWNGWRAGESGLFVNLTDAAYQTAIVTQALSDMPFRQAHRVAAVYGGQRLFNTGSSIFRKKLLSANRQTLSMCISSIESFGYSAEGLANAYALFIGPDKMAWPKPPIPAPFPIPSEASK